MAKQEQSNLIFLPKYETTKGLEKHYQQLLLNILSSDSCLNDRIKSKPQDEISAQLLIDQKEIGQDASVSDVVKNRNLLLNVYKFENQVEEICKYHSKIEGELEKAIYEANAAKEKNISSKSTHEDNGKLKQSRNEPDVKYFATPEKTIPGDDSTSCNENENGDANKTVILQNLVLKPPQYQNPEDSSDSQIREVSHREKRYQRPVLYEHTFETDEMEEPFQSSGSEYVPSSDDEEEEDRRLFMMKLRAKVKEEE